jgi:hypothetical protein
MEPTQLSLLVGWTSMAAGATSGAAIGRFFHNENWMGGYASFQRRMMRLGHIAFFGLGIMNVLLALSVASRPVPSSYAWCASSGFAVAAVTMPTCCFLTGWRAGFRHFFPIPVVGMIGGLGGVLGGWLLT